MLDLKLDREGVPPKDAATIILVRDTDDGVELFCVERSKQSRFLGGAIVFPGGKLDPSDTSEEWIALTSNVREIPVDRAKTEPFTTDVAHLRALAVAACRETLEEAGMLHVSGGSVTQDEVFALRTKLTIDPAALRAFLAERSLKLDLAALHPLSRWVTPTSEARRYDTRFFIAIAPPGQTGAHDEHETMSSFWATPSEVLRRWAKGEVQVAPPTHRTIALLDDCKTTEDVLSFVATSGLDPICPRLVQQKIDDAGTETLALALPGDPEHSVRETRIAGPSRYVLRGERWMSEHAPL